MITKEPQRHLQCVIRTILRLPISTTCIRNPKHVTRKGSKAYLSSSERYLTLHIIRHRPLDKNSKL